MQSRRLSDAAWADVEDPDAQSVDYRAAELQILGEGKSQASRRARNWVQQVHRYEQHWEASGRAPRERTRDLATLPDEERRMGEWARYQRRFEPELCVYQRARLDHSPAFQWDPNHAAWLIAYRKVMRRIATTGRLPMLTGSDADEFRDARWLGRQLLALRDHRLPGDRTTRIEALVALPAKLRDGTGTWRSRSPQETPSPRHEAH